ncbi:MAG: hypothetical protein K8I29_18295 [Alphaproteobacteria bacterium]|uniref:DUF155 domain-containing protein n=1 Tax=Candidatus Nitrobium versatile TaxID=2884831 RepID=A0A953M3C8_9BACT|nr:hypothetical protein [Candidatus Nitrobium versatile]
MTGGNGTVMIRTGRILIYRLYDIAYEIDLSKVEEKLKEAAKRLRIERRPFSKAFEFTNPPVVFQLTGREKIINGAGFRVNVYSRAYEYGVVSIILEIPVSDMEIARFQELALALEEDDGIDRECRDQLTQVISILGDSLIAPEISSFEEDYTVFFITALSPEMDMNEFLSRYDISKLMLYEEEPLSVRIRDELMVWRFSYHRNDGVVLTWDNALIMEPSGSMDIPDILEFANAQFLELRYYDHIVDRELYRIYESISAKGALSIWKIRKYEELAAKVMRTVAELTDITEKIDNSLKVTEDVYYAKIYMAALKIFRVKEWEGSIKRKLDLVARVYDMLYREIANKRTELLEAAIVLLIIVEIVLFLFRG